MLIKTEAANTNHFQRALLLYKFIVGSSLAMVF